MFPGPSQPTQQCSSLAWEGIPKGQMGDGGSEKEVKISGANLELSTDHVQTLFLVLFLNKLVSSSNHLEG